MVTPGMNLILRWMTAGASLALFSLSPLAGASDEVTWKNGLRINGENASLKVGGRIQHDMLWITSDGDDLKDTHAELDGATEFRRARLFMSGTLYNTVEFKAQYDFAGGDADFKTVSMAIATPAGKVTAGQFHEPFSLEELTSSNYITFMERSLPTAFGPSRKTGVALQGSTDNEVVTYGAGYFRNANGYGDEKSGMAGYGLTGRVTASPLYEDDGERVGHVGLSVSHRTQDSYQIKLRPSVHLHERLIKTPEMAIDNHTLINVEGALVMGPLSVQGEFLMNPVALDNSETEASVVSLASESDDPTFTSYYASVSYFLTGENRNYKRSAGKFDRIKVKENYTGKGDGGAGAWEIAARVANASLNDGSIEGGEMTDITIGLNWYLNNASRVMFNFVHADVKDVGTTDSFQTRFQVDF